MSRKNSIQVIVLKKKVHKQEEGEKQQQAPTNISQLYELSPEAMLHENARAEQAEKAR